MEEDWLKLKILKRWHGYDEVGYTWKLLQILKVKIQYSGIDLLPNSLFATVRFS